VVDLVMVLANGMMRAFGPRDAVLKGLVGAARNAEGGLPAEEAA